MTCIPVTAAAARAAFPRGLEQPPDAYRFGTDALLLGAWAAHCLEEAGAVPSIAELGSGCGAALFALLLHPALTRPPSQALGVDDKEALCAAARRNAERLGLSFCRFIRGDVGDSALLRQCGHSAFAAVLANPPYDLPGRRAARPLRERALRSTSHPDAETFRKATAPAALEIFCRAASALLPHHGRFYAIFPAGDISRLLSALSSARLGIRRLLPVHADRQRPALRLLAEARRDAAADCRLLPPLFLHEEPREEGPRWTAQARAFCPWLDGGHGAAAQPMCPPSGSPCTRQDGADSAGPGAP